MDDISLEENKEKLRHDKEYKKVENENLFIEPIHYQKFEKIKTHIHCYTYAVKSLGDIKGQKVLDLGCGTGWFSVILAKRGAVVEGIDISTTAIEIAKKRAIINSVSDIVRFRVMSFYNLDFPDEYFDKIIGLSALHHMSDKKLLCNSLYKILKPYGKVVFNEPFGNSTILERLRLFVPIAVQEEDRSHWNEQVKYEDLEPFKDKFYVECEEFQFFSRLDRIFKQKWIINFLGIFDVKFLKMFPFLKKYARDIVIILRKNNI
ncbi:MAG: methyltransferase domain-containing protein [Candidatus Scalindua sp.]|nr:methyltransferase domain-containing protein [Candidatus Scalindua sp.]